MTQGGEIKKELACLSGLLVDIPDEDDLKPQLETQQQKLKVLARKLLGFVFGMGNAGNLLFKRW